MASQTSQEEARPLNPEMVYQPATPASMSFNSPRDFKVTKVHRVSIAILRGLLFLLNIVAIVLGCMPGGHLGQIILVVLFFLCLFWNLAQIAGGFLSKSKIGCSLPRFHCQVGNLICLCNETLYDEDENDADEDPERAGLIGNNDDQDPSTHPGRAWIVDFAFGLVFLVVFICTMVARANAYDRSDVAVRVFAMLFSVFHFLITILSWVKIYRKTGSSAAAAENFEYRIRLPTEPEHRKSASKNISVSA